MSEEITKELLESPVILDWSRLKEFRSCPQRYKYSVEHRYIEKPELSERERYNFLFGNIMHSVLETIYRSYIVDGELTSEKELLKMAKKELPKAFEKAETLLCENYKYLKQQGLKKKADRTTKYVREAERKRLLTAYREKHQILKTITLDISDPEVRGPLALQLKEIVAEKFEEGSKGITFGVKYKPKKKEQYRDECIAAVDTILKCLVDNKLFGSYASSEVRVVVETSGLELKGILDGLIMYRDQNNEQIFKILDWKSTKAEDPGQLHFYAMLIMLKFGDVNIETCFGLIRSGEVVSVETSKSHLNDLIKEVLEVRDYVIAGEFEAKPKKSVCRRCPYIKLCEDYQVMMFGRTDNKAKELLESDESEVLDLSAWLEDANGKNT